MRPLIYATFITLVHTVAGVVQATVINQLDGKLLLCKNKSNQTNPYFGSIFDSGKVNTWIVVGHLKKRKNQKVYYLRGTSEVFGKSHIGRRSCSIAKHSKWVVTSVKPHPRKGFSKNLMKS